MLNHDFPAHKGVYNKRYSCKFFKFFHTVHGLTINTSSNKCTPRYTICDIQQLLHVLALWCHPQGVIITKHKISLYTFVIMTP